MIRPHVRRVLDIGCGDGRLLAIALAESPTATGVGVDFSEPMLGLARRRFDGGDRVCLVPHDLAEPLPDVGTFDLVVSGFAIHHLEDARKRSLFAEVLDILKPGASFVNVEHVSSATPCLHADWIRALGIEAEDPSNRCAPVETQLTWMRDLGFADVDCLWKWRELALLVGSRAA